MAFLWCDSCGDHYTAAQMMEKWTENEGFSKTLVTGRNGNGIGGTAGLWKALQADCATLIVGFAYKFTALPLGLVDVVRFMDYTTYGNAVSAAQCGLKVDVDGSLKFYRGATLLCQSAPGVIRGATWQFYEVKVVFATGATGSVDVHVDEVSVCSATNVRTSASANAFSSIVAWNVLLGAQAQSLDDVYICDGTGGTHNTFLGDNAILVLFPSADGRVDQWNFTGAASAYQTVNEHTPDDDTSYAYDGPTTTVSDNFNRANAVNLGGNWTVGPIATLFIDGNTCATNNIGGTSEYEYWSANTFSPNQYSEATILSVNNFSAVVVRGSAVADTYYGGGCNAFSFGNNRQRIWKRIAGVDTSLAVAAATVIAANDLVRLTVSGTLLTLSVNGVNVLSVIDTTLATGNPGLASRSAGTLVHTFDDWTGGGVIGTEVFAMDDLPATVSSVTAVQNVLCARKDAPGGSREIVSVIGDGASEVASGTAIRPGDDYVFFTEPYDQDPVSAAAWTPAKVNAMQAGAKVTV